MFRLLKTNFRLNIKEFVHITLPENGRNFLPLHCILIYKYIYTHTLSLVHVQFEDGV